MTLNLSNKNGKIAELEERLKAARAEAAKETEKKAYAIGRAVMDEAKKDAGFQKQLADILDRRVKSKRAREALGLDQKGGDADMATNGPQSATQGFSVGTGQFTG